MSIYPLKKYSNKNETIGDTDSITNANVNARWIENIPSNAVSL